MNNKYHYYFHFYIIIKQKEYALSTLKIDLKGNQAFWVLNHPNDNPINHSMISHHISFHENQTHIKTNKKIIDKIIIKSLTPFLHLQGESKIVLFQSFFNDAGFHLLKENINFSPEWKSKDPSFNQEILIGNLEEVKDFSILLILVPRDSKNNFDFIHTSAITDKSNKELKLSSIKHPDFNIGLINFFPDHNLLVFPTYYIHDNSRGDREGPLWKFLYPMF